MSFVFGAIGAVAVIGLFALGVLTGWKLHKRFMRPAVAERPSDKALRELAAQQEAFRQMQNYNADVAYNIGSVEWEEGDNE